MGAQPDNPTFLEHRNGEFFPGTVDTDNWRKPRRWRSDGSPGGRTGLRRSDQLYPRPSQRRGGGGGRSRFWPQGLGDAGRQCRPRTGRGVVRGHRPGFRAARRAGKQRRHTRPAVPHGGSGFRAHAAHFCRQRHRPHPLLAAGGEANGDPLSRARGCHRQYLLRRRQARQPQRVCGLCGVQGGTGDVHHRPRQRSRARRHTGELHPPGAHLHRHACQRRRARAGGPRESVYPDGAGRPARGSRAGDPLAGQRGGELYHRHFPRRYRWQITHKVALVECC